MRRAICLLLPLAACEVAPPPPPPAAPPKVVAQPEAPAPDAAELERLRALVEGKQDQVAEAPTPPAPSKLRPRRRAVEAEVLEEPEPAGPLSLSDDDFAATVGAWKGMRRCLDTDVSRVDSRAGALRVALTIRGDGSVSEAKVLTASEGAAQTISSCVEKGTRRLRFPAFADATQEIVKEAKFVF